MKESRDVESCTEHPPVRDDDKRILPECPKKKEKKKKRAKFDEKHGRKSLPTSPLLQRAERVGWCQGSRKYVLAIAKLLDK